jgi:hypothetical protein
MDKYLRFIEHCKKKKYHANEYLERHHIVPRHAGGTNNKENLIKLSLKDHTLAHKIRYEVYRSQYDLSAYNYMTGQFAKAKRAICAANGAKSKGRKLTEEHKQKISKATSGQNNPFYGKTHTLEVRQKLRESSYGKRWSEESKKKLSKTLKTKPETTHPRRCRIGNEVYSSLTQAAIDVNISKSLLMYRLNSTILTDYKWIDPPREEKRSKTSKKVLIDGTEYQSISQAASSLGLHPSTVSKRCKSNVYANYFFIET